MSLKSELEKDPGVPVNIRWGGPGSFDVYSDGKLIFSKKQTGRLPSAAEIRACLRRGQGGSAAPS
ncbi:MAG TPA: Rdx family protein [Terriglobales bacterium]|nr:Rdx family protein [Terriglobales bacterium]